VARGARGPENFIQVHTEPGVLIGVASSTKPAAGPDCAALSVDDDYVVVADASLYYVPDLLGKLNSALSPSATPSQLILAAYRAFGRKCVDHLEGDFAFVIWNRHTHRVDCSRDFAGRRPLFLAEWSGGLIVATSLDSIAALAGFQPQVNETAVGADAAGLLFSLDNETCMRGVQSLRAGYAAWWAPQGSVQTERMWTPGPMNTSTLPFDEAADHLLELISIAVRERLSSTAPTAVWLSGGRDSPAVFAAGMHARRGMQNGRLLVPISWSHPPGDSGRENETIEDITRFWEVEPSWVDAQGVPMFPHPASRSSWGAEPFAPPFETLTRELARVGRDLGASIALDGYGGDFLFHVSRVYLADLVARGRVTHALRDWRKMDGTGAGLRGFFAYGVQPNLPRWSRRALSIARGGRPLRDPMEQVAPPWVSPRFVQKSGLADRFESLGPASQGGSSATEREARFYLSHQFFARVNARMAGYALEQGVEVRSPLLDRRVVAFALSRPREDRNKAGDNKRLLRAAMRGLLPDHVLAMRRYKTGTLTSYFNKHMKTAGLEQLTALLPAPALAAAGIIEPALLIQAVARYREEGVAYAHAESLFCTLQAELWLRARSGSHIPAGRAHQQAISA
jgi:asparagine synthase (glutamine-hydrolysing)